MVGNCPGTALCWVEVVWPPAALADPHPWFKGIEGVKQGEVWQGGECLGSQGIIKHFILRWLVVCREG